MCHYHKIYYQWNDGEIHLQKIHKTNMNADLESAHSALFLTLTIFLGCDNLWIEYAFGAINRC